MAVPPLLKSLDYFFVLRPMLFIPGWSTLLAGYLIAGKNQFYYPPETFLSINYFEILLLLIIFSAAMGASFLLNQLMDIEGDLKNKKLFILSENHITKKSAVIETFVLSILSLVLASRFGLWIFLVTLMFIVLTGYMYNFKPFILKDRPLGSIISNALMGWLAFATGWLAVNQISLDLISDSLPYLLFNTALYFFTILPDVPGDKKSNKKTLAVLHGFNMVIFLAILCYLAGFILAFFLKDNFALIFSLGTLPFFVAVAIKRNIKATIRATKYGIFFFAFALWLKVPYYFLLHVVIFIFTRWYFNKRFKYDYPNFKGE
jgi:4-hydroxybenzoate polyprenyltransferase